MNHRQRIPPNPPYQGGQPAGRGDCSGSHEGATRAEARQPAGRGDCFLPYNKALGPRAKELRKNMTEAEKRIWYEIFRNKQFEDLRWLRQRPIADFIVDFYCAELKLVVEVDGGSHFTQAGKVSDEERTKILEGYGLTVIRFTNEEVLQNLAGVYQSLLQYVTKREIIRIRQPETGEARA